MPIEFYNNQKQNNIYRCALEAFMNPIKNLNKENAVKQINELYKLKKTRLANTVEYSSLERLEELLGIYKCRE